VCTRLQTLLNDSQQHQPYGMRIHFQPTNDSENKAADPMIIFHSLGMSSVQCQTKQSYLWFPQTTN
jgi:hypothetical protein